MQKYEHPTYGTLCLGRAPRAFGHVTPLSAVRAMRATPLPPLPVTLNQAMSPDVAHMFGNNQYGDCTCAGMGNAEDLVSYDAQGRQVAITDADVLSAYSAITGFSAGPPPVNDAGASEQDVLHYWQTEGFPLADGTRLKAGPVFEVNPSNIAGICEAIMEFGFVYIGISIPSGLMEDLPALWTDDPSFGAIEGGHCVLLHSFDRTNPNSVTFGITTWGTNGEFRMRQDFLLRYCDEVYAVFLPAWLRATGKTPFGFDEAGLAAIGGEVGEDLTSVEATHVDHGALEAARYGIARSSHWATVEREHKAAYPDCAAGGRGPIQVHHKGVSFHVAKLLGRGDLELTEGNLISLTEGPDEENDGLYHLYLGHGDDFQKDCNPHVDEDVMRFQGVPCSQIKLDPVWQSHAAACPPAWSHWTRDMKVLRRQQLDVEFPIDRPECRAVVARFPDAAPTPYAEWLATL
jgi:hypothetical protein